MRNGTILAGVLACACAHEATPKPRRVAVMPVESSGAPAQHGQVLQASIAAELDVSPEHGAVTNEEIRRALRDRNQDLPACVTSDECLTAVGELSRANEVLALRLVVIDGRQVVSARLVDVAGGVAIEDMEETVDGDRWALAGYAPELVNRLFPPPAPRWFERWWLWTGAAALVGASVATAALIMSSANDNVIRIGGR